MYPVVVAAPDEWLQSAYKGEREVGETGIVLFVDGKAMMFVQAEVKYEPFGKGWVKILQPERYVPPGAEIKLVTKIGGFLLFKGSGSDVEIVENPKPKNEADMISEKARASLEKLGVGVDDDEF
jgi:hypothetical protein